MMNFANNNGMGGMMDGMMNTARNMGMDMSQMGSMTGNDMMNFA